MASTPKSSRWSILNSEPLGYSESARRILGELGDLEERNLDRDSLLAAVPEFDVLMVRLAHTIDEEVIDAAERLSVVVSPTTGLDHIDVDYAAARGIAVLSLRGEHDFLSSVTSTAEHTWTLLLALIRHLPGAHSHVLDGGWDRDRFRGSELQGKRLGIVGLGRIGSIVAEYGRAFRMEVVAYDPEPRSWLPWVARVDSLDELASAVDVLSVHVPLESSTVGLVDEAILGRMRRGSVLINTARAEIVDAGALLAALEDGVLGGAATDVLEAERDTTRRLENPLISYARSNDNLIITPHIAGATSDAMERTEVFMAEKLRRFLSEETPR